MPNVRNMSYPAYDSQPTVVPLANCRFAVHRICSLEESRGASFGGQWDWFEMLIRPQPRFSSLSPYEFVTSLYQQFPVDHIDQGVLDRAAAWLFNRKRPTQLSINVHPRSLVSPFFLDRVVTVQKRLTPLRHALCLELVEFGECLDRDALVEGARHLREQGIQIVLDDFGAHFNCFDLCLAGVVDVIKIDAAMVNQLHQNTYQQAVVASIQALGKGIGASVIAEGVERADVVDILRNAGVGFAQGFFFHKPELAEI